MNLSLFEMINYSRNIFTLLAVSSFFVFGFTCNLHSQNTCQCAGNTVSRTMEPDTVFTFMNQKKYYVCGTFDVYESDSLYTEFVVGICGDSIPTAVWDAMDNCKISKDNDTVVVSEMHFLPVYAAKAPIWIATKVNKYYYTENTFNDVAVFNPQFIYYDSLEIDRVISEAKKPVQKEQEYLFLLSKKLLVAAISGSTEANELLMKMPARYGLPDGEFGIGWEEIIKIYNSWKSLTDAKKN